MYVHGGFDDTNSDDQDQISGGQGNMGLKSFNNDNNV